MATLSELTVQVITARLAKRDMNLEELQKEISAISIQLKNIDEGTLQDAVTTEVTVTEEPKPQKLNLKHYFKKDEVICIICNLGFKTLKRHLTMAHDLKPGEYRKQFNIPSTQTLVAKNYSESRRQLALDKGLGDGLVKYRVDKAAKKVAVPVPVVEIPVVEVEVPVVTSVKKAPKVTKSKLTTPVEKKKTPAPAKGKKSVELKVD
jgi:predicted transcriptional regulator